MSRMACLSACLFLFAAAAVAGDAALEGKLRERIAAEDFDGALAAANALIEVDDGSVLAWQSRAYALHRLGRSDEAQVAYERTLVLAPENAWAWRNLAELLAAGGRFPEAVAAAKRAVAIAPADLSGWQRLTRIQRESGDYDAALASAEAALAAGVDPAWARVELAYVAWALGELDVSRDQWRAAREAGADPEACEHGEDLADWDRPTGHRREREEVAARRRGEGEEWVFDVGSLEVHTRVGPSLPRDLHRLVVRIQEEYERFLDAGGDRGGVTRLFLSRTLEEHERRRVRVFPEGFSGRAFFVHSRGRGRGRWNRGPGGPPSLDVYAAYSAPGLERSLSHELAHVLVHASLPRARNLPVWLDEGIATYLELAPDDDGRLRSRGPRKDLLATLDDPAAAGSLLPLRALLSAQREAFHGTDGRVHYAQAWSLVQFLLHGNTLDGRAKLRAYLAEIDVAGMRPDATVFSTVYGDDLDRLETSWREYTAGLAR